MTSGNNMMDFKNNARASTSMVVIPAFLARPFIAPHNGVSKCFPFSGITEATIPAFPIAMSLAGSNTVGVFGFCNTFVPYDLTFFSLKPLISDFRIFTKKSVNFRPIVVRMMALLKTHSAYGWMIGFGKSFVPSRLLSGLRLATIGMMSALIFWNTQASAISFVAVDGESSKFLATSASADSQISLLLNFRNAHNFLTFPNIIQGNWKETKNCVNCWKPLRANAATASLETVSANAENAKDWAISSQASQGCGEGSTTRAWSPERTVKPQECATRKGRYSLVLLETSRSADKEPHDNKTNSVPYSGKLDDLSLHPVKTIINKVLKNDATKWFDASAVTQFNSTPLRVAPTAGTSTSAITLTTNGTATITNAVAFNKQHAKAIVDTMKERNIPAYEGDDYFALAWPTTYRTLKNDLESIHQYTDRGFTMIMNGEIGRYENVRYVEQTNIPKGGAADSTTWNAFTRTADAWNGGNSDWIYFFGADTVAEAIACPEEMRGKIPTDYGRSKGVAWYYLGGFGLVHGSADAANARIVKWDSAQ